MRHRLRSELGQTSIEFMGILAAVGAVLAILLTAAPGIGHTITCKIDAQIAKVTGGAGAVACADVRGEPTEACVIKDSNGQLKASLTAFSIKGGGEVKMLRETLSDGTVRITLSGGGSLGLEGKVGASGGVDIGNFSATEGAKASGNVSVKGEGGGIWEFKSKSDADDFVDIVRNKARDGAINAAGGPAGHTVTWLFGEDREVPDPRYTYVQGGVVAAGSAEAGAGTAYANGGLDASAIVGAKKDNVSGETTIYYTLKGSGELSAGALIGAGGQADLEGQLAVTVDKNGKPVKAQVVGKGGLSATDLGDGGQFTGLNPKQLVEKFKGKGSEQDGYRGEIRGTLNLKDDPANAQAFQDFLNNPFTGTRGLVDRFGKSATWDARVYKFDRDKYGGDVAFGAGLAFGIEGGYEGVDSELKGAWYWGPNSGGVQPWATCK